MIAPDLRGYGKTSSPRGKGVIIQKSCVALFLQLLYIEAMNKNRIIIIKRHKTIKDDC